MATSATLASAGTACAFQATICASQLVRYLFLSVSLTCDAALAAATPLCILLPLDGLMDLNAHVKHCRDMLLYILSR